MDNTFGNGGDPLQAAIDSMGGGSPTMGGPGAVDLGAPAPMDTPPMNTTPDGGDIKQEEETEAPAPMIAPSPAPTFGGPEAPAAAMPEPSMGGGGGDLAEVRKQALGELKPLLKDLDMPADKKFGMYKEIVDGGDKTAIGDAYETAKSISEPKEKADALLFIIDKTN